MYASAYVWAKVLSYLEERMTSTMVSASFDDAEVVELNDEHLIIYSPSDFRREVISRRYSGMIQDALKEVFNSDAKLIVFGDKELESFKTKGKSATSMDFNPQFTFDNFVVGPSNRMAHSAAIAVSNTPGQVYNPLFIYGHSGLGKTHLLMAIMDEIKSNNPNADIIYTSAEHFTNDLVNHIGNHNTHIFHEKYRSCDVLLVDDVQFISRGDQVQEEFFHTFNALTSNGSQIVLTSDRPPKEMMTLEERLRTRFEMGLIADIQPPTLETRMAIVKKKALDHEIELTDDVIKFIADNIKKNIRQIEGIIKRIKAYQDVEGIKINLSLAKRAISDIINDAQPVPVTVENIINEVSRTFNVSAADIRSDKRNANISQARQVAIYIVDQVTGLSLKSIGSEFGNKHHSTIIYALKEIKGKIEKDVALKATVDDIIKNINES